MKKVVLALGAFCFAASLNAQYPYPPGTMPPSPYPPGGPQGGIPMPSRGKKNKQKENKIEQTLAADGLTLSNDGKTLVIATEDGRRIEMTLNPATKFTRSGSDIPSSKIIPRTTVHIEADEDDEFYLTATHVDLLKDAPVEQVNQGPRPQGVTPVAEDEPRPTILQGPSADAPDRPILKHGKPQSTSSTTDSDDTTEVATNQPPPKSTTTKARQNESGDFTINSDSEQTKIVRTGDELIDRTKEWALTFTQGLPNYVCEQDTTRYAQRSRSEGWEAQDVITAKVVFEDGREQYKEITVGGKRTNKSMLELGGSVSIGEFASTLRSLFSDASQAEFKFYQSTHVGDTAARIYDFKIALHNSDWFIKTGGQTLVPAYSGSVWVDRSTAEVRRIEMQADNIPKDFPLDSIQWAIDYDEVMLGTGKFLLPVHAENLGCWRGSPICQKNSTDFRDYHKYSGESTITFK